MNLRASAFFVFLVLLSIFPSLGHALNCAKVEEPAIDYYDAAVVGTVLNVKEEIVQKGFTGPKDRKKIFLLDIDRSWKREFKSQVIFESDFTWGFDFEKGEKYLVYLNEENEIYKNSPCSPVDPVNSGNVKKSLEKG